MIKKITKAIFEDGEYAGTYDWQGGLPLSRGETINIRLKAGEKILVYELIEKTVNLNADKNDQLSEIIYRFKLKNLYKKRRAS